MAIINGTANGETLNGTANADTINAYGGNDILIGNGGDDLMYGGDGNDTFRYLNGEDAGSGETASGGAGTDKLEFRGAGIYDLRDVDFLSIEEIEFYADGTDVDKTVRIGSQELDTAT